jgi:hypothetical protein
MTQPNNTNQKTLTKSKQSSSLAEKPVSPQFNVIKQLHDLGSRLEKTEQSLDSLKKGQATITALLVKLNGKVKTPRQAKNVLSRDEVKKLHDEATNNWKNQKQFTESEYEEMAANALTVDLPIEDESEQQKIDAACILVKDYIRTSKLKIFSERIDEAINEYFADNPVVDPAQEEEHCKKIFNQRAWTKTNPTPSDSELAEKLIAKRVGELRQYGNFLKRKSPVNSSSKEVWLLHLLAMF